jgi:hypothetical protein
VNRKRGKGKALRKNVLYILVSVLNCHGSI